MTSGSTPIRTPDQRLRIFVSSTLQELAEEREAVKEGIQHMCLTPVMFELGARAHPPRDLYRAYLAQSDVFVGIYWQRYGWVAPTETISSLEDEYALARSILRGASRRSGPSIIVVRPPQSSRAHSPTTPPR